MVLWTKRIPVTLTALIFLCYSWSFSFTHVVTRNAGSALAVNCGVSTSCLSMVASVTNDSLIIKSLSKANNAGEIHATLRSAFHSQSAKTTANENKNENEPPVDDVEFILLNDAIIQRTLKNFPQFSMNVLAAAIRRLALISARETWRNVPLHPQDNHQYYTHNQLLMSLLETIGSQMIIAQKDYGILSVYALSDVLQALTILVRLHCQSDSNRCDLVALLHQISDSTVEMLTRHDVSELKKLGPIRLLQCLQAMARLGMMETPLHYRIYDQLLKPNVSSRLPAKYLAHGLDTLSIVVINRMDSHTDRETDTDIESFEDTRQGTTDDDPRHSDKSQDTIMLARSFMRRLRKEHVRDTATIDDLCRALSATDDLWHNGGLTDLEDEAAIFGFTTLRAILQKKHATNVQMTPGQMSTMMSAWATLTSNQKEDTVIDDLLWICEGDRILERSSCLELDKIINSIQRLQITNHAGIMRSCGERLLHLTMERPVAPKIFNSILRCPVLLHRRNHFVMEPYIQACEVVFMDPSFMDKCDVAEMANFLWFASIAQWRHPATLRILAQKIIDPKISDRCSPKLASRILATYTTILAVADKEGTNRLEEQFHELTTRVFDCYGGHLLTSKLTPAEVSAALYAYAKASYFQDMGIFDHLLTLMARMSISPDQPTVRQMTQSLWSCGKMSVFDSATFDFDDDHDSEEDNDETVLESESPFQQSAHIIAEALARRADELSHVDVTQSIWALGRLGEINETVISAFAGRANVLVPKMNAVEISNILWGLAKLEYTDNKLVTKMTARFFDESFLLSPKEAAMSLYALGRLGVRDEHLYDRLSYFMIDKIEETSAQAIANTLWAYRNVNLRPPQDLLNIWAVQKLGWLSATPRDPGQYF